MATMKEFDVYLKVGAVPGPNPLKVMAGDLEICCGAACFYDSALDNSLLLRVINMDIINTIIPV